MSDYEVLYAYTMLLENKIAELKHAYWLQFVVVSGEPTITDPILGRAHSMDELCIHIKEHGAYPEFTSQGDALMSNALHVEIPPGGCILLESTHWMIYTTYGFMYWMKHSEGPPVSIHAENAMQLFKDIYNYYGEGGIPVQR